MKSVRVVIAVVAGVSLLSSARASDAQTGGQTVDRVYALDCGEWHLQDGGRVSPASAGSVMSVSTPAVTAAADRPAVAAKRRPVLLVALYASVATLQTADVYMTRAALSRGAVESNPLMQGVAANTGALIAAKAGATAASIYVAERLWRKNRIGAIALMAASNGVLAAVVSHNASVMRRIR